jgi:HAD superfamily hydrolase (TIGR01509 family)
MIPKLIIFDLDGTLYHKNHAYYEADYNSVAQSISSLGNISFEEAKKLALFSKKEFGRTFNYFTKNGIIEHLALDKLFYQNISLEFLDPQSTLPEDLNKLPKETKLCIYTHANELWIQRILEKANLISYFPKENHFTCQVFGHKKNETELGFLHICKQLDIKPVETILVEDEPGNLKYAKAAGLKTVLITEQNVFKESIVSEDADYTFPTVTKFLQSLTAS